MSKSNDNMEPKESRLVRFGLSMDGWLADYAVTNEFKSVPELVRHIVREFKRGQAHTVGRRIKTVGNARVASQRQSKTA